jgi:DNA invertase Pin-like site-specific DNA recombinase
VKPTKSPIYAYLRVSSAGQCDGDGFDRQEVAILKWVTANRPGQFISLFREEGVSGTLDTAFRPALSTIFDRIAALPDDEPRPIVIVEKADRIARDLIVGELILRQFREAGVQVIEAEGGNDLTTGTDNPTATLIRQILAAVAEFEKSSLVNKLRAARERVKKETGRCGGRQPYGHTEAEQATVHRMRLLQAEGKSTRQIALRLNELGYLTRANAPWTHGAVAKILKNSKP